MQALWGQQQDRRAQGLGPKTTCKCRAGLRGAVGLALSLFVLLDGEIADERFRVLTFFYMGAMVCPRGAQIALAAIIVCAHMHVCRACCTGNYAQLWRIAAAPAAQIADKCLRVLMAT